MASKFSELFTEHPREVGETYFQHMAASFGFCLMLMRLAGCALVHGLVPALHRSTVSDSIKGLAGDMKCRAREAQESRMKKAGTWDPGL